MKIRRKETKYLRLVVASRFNSLKGDKRTLTVRTKWFCSGFTSFEYVITELDEIRPCNICLNKQEESFVVSKLIYKWKESACSCHLNKHTATGNAKKSKHFLSWMCLFKTSKSISRSGVENFSLRKRPIKCSTANCLSLFSIGQWNGKVFINFTLSVHVEAYDGKGGY